MLSKFKKYVVHLLVVISFTISGCASKPVDPQTEIKNNIQVMRFAITDVVKDVERRNNLLDSTRSLEATLLAYNQAYTVFVIEFGKLNRKYSTPRAKLEELLTSFRKHRELAMNEVVKLHFKNGRDNV